MTIARMLFTRPTSATRAMEWAGAAMAITGATLLATNTSFSGWGWIAFLGSNLAWIFYSLATGQRGLFTQQVLFTATSLLGIARWLS